jgi:Kef-type K+ transport system membrane component KefB
MNPVAIEGHLTLVLIQWIIIIAAAGIFSRLGKKIGQPLAVGEIAAGIILGPSVFGAICIWLGNHFSAPAIGDIPAKNFSTRNANFDATARQTGINFSAVSSRNGI